MERPCKSHKGVGRKKNSRFNFATICNSAAWSLQFLQKPATNLDAQGLSGLQRPHTQLCFRKTTPSAASLFVCVHCGRNTAAEKCAAVDTLDKSHMPIGWRLFLKKNPLYLFKPREPQIGVSKLLSKLGQTHPFFDRAPYLAVCGT